MIETTSDECKSEGTVEGYFFLIFCGTIVSSVCDFLWV